MSEKPFMQLYVSDFIGDTLSLSTEEVGAYLLILMAMWNAGGSLPDDDRKLSRITRLSVKKWLAARPDIEPFFTVSDGTWRSKLFDSPPMDGRKNAYRQPIRAWVKEAVWKRDGERCVYCGGTEGPFELDHVLPWSRGGEDTSDNLVVSCRACNRLKRDRTPQEMGWMT